MEPWYKLVTPRKEVREGRSFNPDEFAIALEQVVAGTAPPDYRDPVQFFSRTCYTRALREHAGMVLRRLAGKTENTAPVLTLITQFGGGKTHTLTALYHIAGAGNAAREYPGVASLLDEAGLPSIAEAKVGVFVGNAWDPQEGRETPWIDLARQLAGNEGVAALGPRAKESPPGTETLNRVIELAGRPVLLLFDEVLNAITRHKWLAEPMHAFIHNVMRGFVGTTRRAAVMSLPRSQVEMTEWDLQWQERIVKVVGAVAKQLMANDETEISEVVRRRLFEDLGNERVRRNVAKAYADWCFERRHALPPEWTAVDTAATEKKAREILLARFESCYPFHPATLSVFQRKWQALPQYQQTRGTLAMLAQWISIAYREAFTYARREPVLTLGSATLELNEFRGTVLGQLGESRLIAAIDADICGAQAHARALDADTKGALRDIHRRVGTAILFESSGGQVDKIAHLPELHFALGEPEVDTTSIDNAALALESKAFFVRRVGSDGYQLRHQPTLKKVVSDRRASLDEETEIKPTMRSLVKGEFERGATIPIIPFPKDGASVQDSPRLGLVLLDPEVDWSGSGVIREQIADWTKRRSTSDRLYPGALVWCVKKPGRELREKVELLLAWKRVKRDIDEGILGTDFDRGEYAEIHGKVSDAEEDAKDEVWASYRFAVLADAVEADGLKTIDLGAGHSSAAETLCGRVIAALKSAALLNESVGAGYIERHWPPALKESGAWPLPGLRKSFVDGTLTRLLDPDAVLRAKLVELVAKGDLGLASGPRGDGTYDRLWHAEPVATDEVLFDPGVFVLTKARAIALKAGLASHVLPEPTGTKAGGGDVGGGGASGPMPSDPTPPPQSGPETRTLRIEGDVPPEVWNRLGTKLMPKLRSGGAELVVGVRFSVSVRSDLVASLTHDLHQVLTELGLRDKVKIEQR
jgi:hypothetical protein